VAGDMPGRSMNVIEAKVEQELDAIIEKVKSDATIKSAVSAGDLNMAGLAKECGPFRAKDGVDEAQSE
jgi:hypothetical protein